MVRNEQYVSFQIVRPVEPTESLRNFLATATFAGNIIFNNGNVVDISRFPDISGGESLVQELKNDELNDGNAVGAAVSRHEVYARNGLKLPLLDRRSPKPNKVQALMRAYSRFDEPPAPKSTSKRTPKNAQRMSLLPTAELQHAALQHDIVDSSELLVTFNGLTLVHDPKQYGLGYEIALVPDPKTAEAHLLLDESVILFNTFASAYRDLAYPTSKTSLEVSFCRTPNTPTSDEDIGKFMSKLEAKLPLTLTLSEIQPKFAT